MHAPQLKKWTAIIDHHSGIRLLACNRDLNLALPPALLRYWSISSPSA